VGALHSPHGENVGAVHSPTGKMWGTAFPHGENVGHCRKMWWNCITPQGMQGHFIPPHVKCGGIAFPHGENVGGSAFPHVLFSICIVPPHT